MNKSIVKTIKMLVAVISGAFVATSAVAQSSPPQINAYQDEQPIWNKTAGFGPVPAKLQKAGDAECRKFKYDRAIGYSAKTLNADGQTFQKGGFLCQTDQKSSN